MAGWLLNIEAPLWAVITDADDIENQIALLDLLDNIPEDIEAMLFRKNILDIICRNAPMDIGYWLDRISRIPSLDYPENKKACHLKTNPEIITNITDEEQKTETCYQIGALFGEQNPKKIHVLKPERVSEHDDIVTVVQDKKIIKKIYIVDAGRDVLCETIEAIRPKLVQGKHHSKEHSIGKGKVASTFKGWNQNDESYAKWLLEDAFKHFSGCELPAKILYSWDAKNKCFVRFMHSGNNEYHGHDYPEKDVPDDVKHSYDLPE